MGVRGEGESGCERVGVRVECEWGEGMGVRGEGESQM